MKYSITDKNGRSKSFGTARELFDELSDRNNGWWEGEGSLIEKNNESLFNTGDYLKFVTDAHLDNKTPSIKAILAHKDESANVYY